MKLAVRRLAVLFLLLLASPALAQQAPAPAVRGDNATLTFPGASSARTLLELGSRYLDVRAYGAVCDGTTDDAAAIQAAVNAASSYVVGGRTIQGARVYVPPTPNGCAIGSTITLGNGDATPTSFTLSTRNNVSLVGDGMPFGRVGLWNSLGNTGSRLRWIGPSGGTMVRIAGPTAGNGLGNIALDANSTAATCLQVISGRNADFPNVTCANFTGIGLDLTTRPTNVLASNDSSQLSTVQLRFTNYQSRSTHGGATAINLDGFSNQAAFTASTSGTTLTVSSVSAGYLEVGMTVTGSNVPANTTITALGTGSGGAGTYTLSNSSSLSSQAFTGRLGILDTTRVTFDNTIISMSPSGGATGVRVAFVDQVVLHNTIISAPGTADGTSCGVTLAPVLVPSPFPQNVVFTGHTDLGQELRMCAGANNTITYPGGGLRFDNLTTFDRQIMPADPFTQMASGTYTDPSGWRHEWGMRVQDRAYRNWIANPRFRRVSRGTTFNNTLSGVASGAVTVDGLYFWTDGALGASWSLQRLSTSTSGAMDTGFTNNLLQPYDPEHYIKISLGQVTGETFTRLGWRIPNARSLAGRTVTLSAFVVAGGGTPTIGARLEQNFGTGGSPSSTVVSFATANQTTVPATIRRLQWTFVVPSVSGRVFGTNGDDHVGIYLDLPRNNGVNLYLADAQFEAGSTATAFEMRPAAIDEFLSARVLRPVGGGLTGQALSATEVCLTALNVVPMVRTPTLILRPGASVSLLEGATNRTAASPSITAGCSGSTPLSTAGSINGFTGMTPGGSVMTLPMTTPPFLLSAEP